MFLLVAKPITTRIVTNAATIVATQRPGWRAGMARTRSPPSSCVRIVKLGRSLLDGNRLPTKLVEACELICAVRLNKDRRPRLEVVHEVDNFLAVRVVCEGGDAQIESASL